MKDNIAIKVDNVHKDFFLPHSKEYMLKHKIINSLKKKKKGGEVQRALKGINFEVNKGDFFGVLGRNGSGKSTLLKIISEIYQPTKGKVSKNGRLVPFIELGVGFNPELTGRENVFLNGAMLGFTRTEIADMYDDIVEFAEIEQFMDQKLKNYSSGMKVRLGFSIAIRAEADILVLDEVLAVGDAEFQKKCNNYFQTLKDNNKTIILVTHNMGAVREYCNKAILIEDGVVSHNGSADMVADEYLKQFIKVKKNLKEGKEDKEDGTGEIALEDASIDINDDRIKIEFITKALVGGMDDVVLGFQIKFGRNNLLTGVDSIRAGGGKLIKYNKNEIKTFTFEIPNIYGTSDYDLDFKIRHANGITIFKREKVLSFDNFKTDFPSKLVYTDAKMKITSNSKS